MTFERERIRTAERHRSYADLIDSTVLLADSNEVAFRRIRANIDEIRRWFLERADWRVDLTHELVRLEKQPSSASAHQGFLWCESTLDYELFVWMLWYEEVRDTHQFVCTELIEELEEQLSPQASEAGFSWDSYDHRRALKRVIEEMVRLGALMRLDGSISGMVSGTSDDALYEYTGVARRLHPMMVEDVADVAPSERRGALAVPSENLPAEQRLYRTLLLCPALYAFDDPEAFAVLERRERRARIEEDLRERLGWDLEVTRTYACLLRPTAPGRSSNTFPVAQSAIMHVVLLFCRHVRVLLEEGTVSADEYDRVRMTRARFMGELLKVRREHGDNWGKGLSETQTTIEQLAKDALSKMSRWGLVRIGDDPEEIFFLPLSARFEGVYTSEAIAEEEEQDPESPDDR